MSVLLEMLSDIEHRQWADWAQDYINADDRKRDHILTMACFDYNSIGCNNQAIYIPWAKQVLHAFKAAGYEIKDTSRLMGLLMRLDHTQRQAWLSYQADNMTDDNIARWNRQINTDYDHLSEKEKDSDREWAQKVIDDVNTLLKR